MLNALQNIHAMPDTMLRDVQSLALEASAAAEDVDIAVVEGAVVFVAHALVPVPLPTRLPDNLLPQSVAFPCGGKELSLHLDGYSHASRVRRAFATWPFHNQCFKYRSPGPYYPQPWMVVAVVLQFCRKGGLARGKRAHHMQPYIDVAELAPMRAEMPQGTLALDDLPTTLYV